MNEPHLFTIITVTLNNLAGLKNTALSIHGQTNQDLEWLVIDGGSSDGTVDYLSSVILSASEGSHANKQVNSSATPQNDRFLWTSEPDNGIYDAMNKGIGRAKGRYILFLNAGDALAGPDTLADLSEAIYECSITPDFIYGDALEELCPGECAYKPARPCSKIAHGMFTHHQAMLYRREALANMRYDERYKIAADYDLTVRFLGGTNKVLYLPAPICIFESGGVSQQQVRLGRREQMQIRKQNNLSGPLMNAGIFAAQSLAWQARQNMPNLYWKIKSRGG